MSLDDDVTGMVRDRQRTMRRGVPIPVITGHLGIESLAVVYRLVASGDLYWATSPRRVGGDRYHLVKAATERPCRGSSGQLEFFPGEGH